MSLEKLQEQLGYTFEDQALLRQALTHHSCGPKNNERLEFLGDGLLNFVVANYLFEEFASLSEGDMSRIRAALVSENTLARIGEKIGVRENLFYYTLIGQRPTDIKSLIADSVEALFGAIHVEAGFEKARPIVLHHILLILKNREARLTKDAKTALQEFVQGRGLPRPEYILAGVDKDDFANRYRIECCIDSLKIKTKGTGKSRKEAEFAAATEALQKCTAMGARC